jgi:hypothetical protein
MENREANQAAFEKVVRHLLGQMAQSAVIENDETLCRYRGPGGIMCAIGCLIPDDEYHDGLEGLDACSPSVAALPSLVGLNQQLLVELQNIHDRSDPCCWQELLVKAAARHGLSMPDLEAPNV